LNGRRASQVTSSALQWLNKVSPGKFFLFLNYFDPHAPYSPPEEFQYSYLPKGSLYPGKQLSPEEMNDLYDAEILYMDYSIGQLFENLKRLNLYDNTWFIITSDHGDLLGEHGMFGHGKFLFQEELHIPLIIKYPGTEMSPKKEDEYVQLVDILPMILKRLNIPCPQDIQGNIPQDIKHPIFSEVYPLPGMTPYGEWRALYQGNFKFIWNSKGNHLLINLENDPTESDNLLPKNQHQAKTMALSMNEYIATLPKKRTSGPIQEIDEKTRESLKSLGYIK
jgi:arylsulfatase A-like enzyme